MKEQNMDDLILEFADNLIAENTLYIGEDVSADARAKLKNMKKTAKEGGKQNAKEKKTTRRKTNSSK